MIENLKVNLEVKTNSNNEVEVNGYNWRSLMNSNCVGKMEII